MNKDAKSLWIIAILEKYSEHDIINALDELHENINSLDDVWDNNLFNELEYAIKQC